MSSNGRPRKQELDVLAMQAGVDRKYAGKRGRGWLEQKISGKSRAEFKLEQRVRKAADELREARDMLIEFRMRKYKVQPVDQMLALMGKMKI